jgi:hypothetical protein
LSENILGVGYSSKKNEMTNEKFTEEISQDLDFYNAFIKKQLHKRQETKLNFHNDKSQNNSVNSSTNISKVINLFYLGNQYF